MKGEGGRGRGQGVAPAGEEQRGKRQERCQDGKGGRGGDRGQRGKGRRQGANMSYTLFSQGFYLFPGFLYFLRVSMFPLNHSHLDWPLVCLSTLTLKFHRVSMFLCFSGFL